MTVSYKMQEMLFENGSGFSLQNATVLLQNVTVITKCDVYYKLRECTDHYIIYCTKNIVKTKYNKHKELTFRSIRNYSADIYKQTLERALFPNYDDLHNPDIAYNNFIK